MVWVHAAVELKPTLLGLAAFITAISGVVTTIIAFRKNRTEEFEHMEAELKRERAESERLAQELHELRMGQQSNVRGPRPDET